MRKIADLAALALSWISVACVVFIGAATLVDVVGRYFNHPLYGAFEMIQMAMIFLIFTALPAVTLKREHVTVDLVQGVLPARIKHIALSLVGLIGAVVCGFYALQVWARAEYLQQIGETTQNLVLPVYPFVMVIAVMWVATALCFVVLLIEDARRIFADTGEI
ncbi:MAG: TRAP transporter small permease [Rhizobiaceae bacterium]|nr:TRAP transporter small permease [Rhizobiaceae bacterium]